MVKRLPNDAILELGTTFQEAVLVKKWIHFGHSSGDMGE